MLVWYRHVARDLNIVFVDGNDSRFDAHEEIQRNWKREEIIYVYHMLCDLVYHRYQYCC